MSKALYQLSLMCAALAGAQTYQPNWASLDRRPIQRGLSAAKFGIFIHWASFGTAYAPVIPGKLAIRVVLARDYEGQKRTPDRWTLAVGNAQKPLRRRLSVRHFAPQFHAELFDPAHWGHVFQRSGAKYVALTSKHMRASRLAE